MHTDDAKVLLLKRFRPFEFWQSVTGSLDPDETPAEAARRELFEETGLNDEGELSDSGVTREFTIDPRWLDRYPPGVTENTEHEFRYRLEHPVDVVLNDEEHSQSKWLSVDDAIEVVWSWTNKVALEELREDLA